jgi:FixJ family two-component response regulator
MEQEMIPWNGIQQDVKPANEIFVVDDDKDVRDFLTATLAPEGFPVTNFEDGDSFLREASARVPICVFLDLVMPKRSGLEILKELRARDYRTPIFLMSARYDPPLVVEAIKNGALDYIKKPFDSLAPRLRVRNAVEVWSHREPQRNALEIQLSESCEWFRLTPNEREVIALMRMM